jgi:hypothetical protein
MRRREDETMHGSRQQSLPAVDSHWPFNLLGCWVPTPLKIKPYALLS